MAVGNEILFLPLSLAHSLIHSSSQFVIKSFQTSSLVMPLISSKHRSLKLITGSRFQSRAP